MPELPEVETVRRTVEPLIIDKTIKEVNIWYPNIIMGNSEDLKEELKGKTVLGIDRYGKYLLFRLSNNLTLVSHLRMEGKYRLTSKDAVKDKHDHVEFIFLDDSALRYNDVRKFGRMQLVETGTEFQTTGIKKLGPEPNSKDFTFRHLKEGLSAKKKNIKATLLDQSIVCGLGNIYVDEVLWKSKINPTSIAKKIPDNALKSLFDNINKIMKIAIIEHGTTVHSFIDAQGKTGGYQAMLKVYGHVGDKCQRCGFELKKIKLNGRGTTFCPNCQVIYK